jgi:hypothetical protein
MSANSAIMDMEDDVLAANEMATAIFGLVERLALAGQDDPDVSAVLRCVCHLQVHTDAVVKTWKLAVAEDRAA